LATKIFQPLERRRHEPAQMAVNVLISVSYAKTLAALAALRADHLDPEIANFLS
jgi:hypothetical protein